MFGHIKFFEYILIFWEGRTLKRVKDWLFSFILKIGLACKKIETSQGFWYQGVGADMLFRNSQPPVWITINVPVLLIFPKISGRPFPEVRASLEKN